MIEIPIILGFCMMAYATREVFFKNPPYHLGEQVIIITDQYGDVIRIYADESRIINSMKKINNNTTISLCDTENEICPLTQENIPINTPIRKLNCGHTFTKDRIDIWLRQNNTCPLCRDIVIN